MLFCCVSRAQGFTPGQRTGVLHILLQGYWLGHLKRVKLRQGVAQGGQHLVHGKT